MLTHHYLQSKCFHYLNVKRLYTRSSDLDGESHILDKDNILIIFFSILLFFRSILSIGGAL